LNLLRRDQKNLANLCSGQDDGEKRFSLGEWHSHDPVYLENAQSNIFCLIEELIPFSSHSLVVGKVYELNHSGDKDPLIYQDGDYE
jgi:flavin reductase (DIM6/NTAB) family NADH-FMN oxidoreductase RutF